MRVPVELQPMLRQYKRTCDNQLIDALSLEKTVDYIAVQQREIESLKRKLKAADSDCRASEMRIANLQHRLATVKHDKAEALKKNFG